MGLRPALTWPLSSPSRLHPRLSKGSPDLDLATLSHPCQEQQIAPPPAQDGNSSSNPQQRQHVGSGELCNFLQAARLRALASKPTCQPPLQQIPPPPNPASAPLPAGRDAAGPLHPQRATWAPRRRRRSLCKRPAAAPPSLPPSGLALASQRPAGGFSAQQQQRPQQRHDPPHGHSRPAASRRRHPRLQRTGRRRPLQPSPGSGSASGPGASPAQGGRGSGRRRLARPPPLLSPPRLPSSPGDACQVWRAGKNWPAWRTGVASLQEVAGRLPELQWAPSG